MPGRRIPRKQRRCAGIALPAGALWVLVPLPVVLLVIDRAVIAREERYLERKSGREHLDNKNSVRRWIRASTPPAAGTSSPR